MKNAVFLIALLISVTSNAQAVYESYYSDTTIGNLDHIFHHIKVNDGIIISGKRDFAAIQEPILMKLDLAGNVVWAVMNPYQESWGSCSFFNIFLFEDGNVYGFTRMDAINSNQRHIWKVNATNGQIEYITPFYDGSNKTMDFAEYDDSTFVAVYTIYDGSTLDNAHIALMDKATGDTLQTRFITSENMVSSFQTPHVVVDDNRNIYYAVDRWLTKLNKKNLDFKLWTRDYSVAPYYIELTSDLYLDNQDELYYIGHEETGGFVETGTVVKVDKTSGYADWSYTPGLAPSYIADYADDGDYLYLAFRKKISGSSNIGQRVVKLRKSDGNLEWNVGHMTTVLGTGLLDVAESANAIDVNCDGDVYTTGFYNDDFGPGAWSIQKLAGSNGAKLLEHNIALDSLNVDQWSIGMVSAVIRDTAYVLGQLQTPNSPLLGARAYFTALEPVTGAVFNRRYIQGGYQLPSKTLEIKNFNDSMYVLKQVGQRLVVESYNAGNVLIWQKALSDSLPLKGSRLEITPNDVFVSAQTNFNDNGMPFTDMSTEKIKIYKMGRIYGNNLFVDSILVAGDTIKMLELEADNSRAYMFYLRNGAYTCSKWQAFLGFSPAIQLATNVNTAYFEGNCNQVSNYSADSLLLLLNDELVWLIKPNMTSTIYETLTSGNHYLDHYISDSILYAVGRTSSNLQTAFKYDLINQNFIWDQNYDLGYFSGLDFDFYDQMYVTGVSDTLLVVHKIDESNGNIEWNYLEDPSLYANSRPYDICVNDFGGYIAVSGGYTLPSNQENALIRMLSFQGDSLYFEDLKDTLGMRSQGYTIAVSADTLTWVGGAHNKLHTLKEGFIKRYDITLPFCTIPLTGTEIVSACTSFTSPYGNSWNVSGIYNEQIPAINGCDSTIIYDLTILNTSSSTDVITSCNGITWIDGNTYNNSNYTAQYLLTNAAGCDSIVTLNFTMNSAALGTDVISSCTPVVWLDGNSYSNSISGPSYTFPNAGQNGCDSIVTLNLTIISVNTSVTNLGSSLIANAGGMSYQWINCATNSDISGATSQSFAPSSNGSYAVEVTNGSCTDTSACFPINSLAISDLKDNPGPLLFPNPVNEYLTIVVELNEPFILNILTMEGKLVQSWRISSTETTLDLSALSSGMYLLDFSNGDQQRIVKE